MIRKAIDLLICSAYVVDNLVVSRVTVALPSYKEIRSADGPTVPESQTARTLALDG